MKDVKQRADKVRLVFLNDDCRLQIKLEGNEVVAEK